MLTDYPPPFDQADADVIMRSSDNIHFRFHKLILSLASPFFRGLFSLPQPSGNTQSDDDEQQEIPIVDLQDDAQTVDALLRFCYPTTTPVLVTLADATCLLRAGHKYSIEEAVEQGWRRVLELVGNTEPLRAYAIACKYRLRDEATAAARLTLRQSSPFPFYPELELISGGDLHRITDYHYRCGLAARKVAQSNYKWVNLNNVYWNHPSCDDCPLTPHTVLFVTAAGTQKAMKVTVWWKAYMDTIAELIFHQPWPGFIKQAGILPAMRDEIVKCHHCLKGTFTKWDAFLNSFEKAVENAVNEVSLMDVYPGFFRNEG
jgi:hypothetical protein